MAKKPLKLKRKQLSNKQRAKHNFALGSSGEKRAQEFLVEKAYKIFDSNVQIGSSEIDIVAFDPKYNELVFVEVKTRTSSEYAHPSKAVNKAKLRSMNFVAEVYCKRKQLNYDYRFDIIAISPDGIEHFESVSW